MGWYREANVKSMESRYIHALLAVAAPALAIAATLCADWSFDK
jgi:hypothetical protein